MTVQHQICQAFRVLSHDVGLFGRFDFRQEKTTFQLPQSMEDIDCGVSGVNTGSCHCHCSFDLVHSFKQIRIRMQQTKRHKFRGYLGMPPTAHTASLAQTEAWKNHRDLPETRVSPERFSRQGILTACHFYECLLPRWNSVERPLWKQGV